MGKFYRLNTGNDGAFETTSNYENAYIYDVEYDDSGNITNRWLGGSGKNISYEFITTDFSLDDGETYSSGMFNRMQHFDNISISSNNLNINGLKVYGKYIPSSAISQDQNSRLKYINSSEYNLKKFSNVISRLHSSLTL